jgi:hypothetical protein
MIDDSLGAAWHELRRLAHLLSEVAHRVVDLEARMDRIDPPAPEDPHGHQ